MVTTDCRDSPPTLVEATKRLQETMKNARVGKKADALNGVVSVVQSAFAAVLKGEVDATEALAEQCVELEKQLKEKDETRAYHRREFDSNISDMTRFITDMREEDTKMRASEAKAKAGEAKSVKRCAELHEQVTRKGVNNSTLIDMAIRAVKERDSRITGLNGKISLKDTAICALEANIEAKDVELTAAKANVKVPAIDIIITQAGYTTRCYNVDEKQALAVVLVEYCKDTDQSINSMLVRTNDMHSSGRVVDPGKETMEPKPLKQGKMKYYAFEVIKVEPSAAKRKAADGESTGSGKKQKV
ncbi:hypothetical protein LTR17_020480 [Elasticomyces elasticus]|nr:hypothetical protein LTR17_020480 [Elasticomyces elasticus]